MTKDRISEEFLAALNKFEKNLLEMSFERDKFIEKGQAFYIYYKRKNTVVEFLFGPPQFEIDIIIYISNKKFEFKDLLKISEIFEWISLNRYKREHKRNINNEMLWFIDLLKVSLVVLDK